MDDVPPPSGARDVVVVGYFRVGQQRVSGAGRASGGLMSSDADPSSTPGRRRAVAAGEGLAVLLQQYDGDLDVVQALLELCGELLPDRPVRVRRCAEHPTDR